MLYIKRIINYKQLNLVVTDSGGYQIFSMGHGSVSNEIKGKRDAGTMGWNQSLINIDENGASFRSYIDGLTYDLTPEKSIDIQRKVTPSKGNSM